MKRGNKKKGKIGGRKWSIFSVLFFAVQSLCFYRLPPHSAQSVFDKIYSCAIFLLWFVLATVCTAASRKGPLEGAEGQPVYRFFFLRYSLARRTGSGLIASQLERRVNGGLAHETIGRHGALVAEHPAAKHHALKDDARVAKTMGTKALERAHAPPIARLYHAQPPAECLYVYVGKWVGGTVRFNRVESLSATADDVVEWFATERTLADEPNARDADGWRRAAAVQHTISVGFEAHATCGKRRIFPPVMAVGLCDVDGPRLVVGDAAVGVAPAQMVDRPVESFNHCQGSGCPAFEKDHIAAGSPRSPQHWCRWLGVRMIEKCCVCGMSRLRILHVCLFFSRSTL